MKRIAAMLVVFAIIIGAGCTKGYRAEKVVDDLKITLSLGSGSLVKGDNTITLTVTDSAGRPVSDATVGVRYYMPPMPGMAPMDYMTQPMRKGDAYLVTANISMEGGWKVEVSVARPGKPTAMATFNLDAR